MQINSHTAGFLFLVSTLGSPALTSLCCDVLTHRFSGLWRPRHRTVASSSISENTHTSRYALTLFFCFLFFFYTSQFCSAHLRAEAEGLNLQRWFLVPALVLDLVRGWCWQCSALSVFGQFSDNRVPADLHGQHVFVSFLFCSDTEVVTSGPLGSHRPPHVPGVGDIWAFEAQEHLTWWLD